jgi:hypothetical protein
VSSCSKQPVRVCMNYWYSGVVLLMAKWLQLPTKVILTGMI